MLFVELFVVATSSTCSPAQTEKSFSIPFGLNKNKLRRINVYFQAQNQLIASFEHFSHSCFVWVLKRQQIAKNLAACKIIAGGDFKARQK